MRLVRLLTLAALLGGLVAVMAAPVAGQQYDAQVINGTPAPIGAYPFFAQLYETDGDFRCGATLIEPQYLLTAAHCVFDGDRVVDRGLVFFGEVPATGPSRGFAGVAVHPDWTDTALDPVDLAVIRLDHPVANTPVARSRDANESVPGTTVRILGLGLTVSGRPPSGSPTSLRQGDLVVDEVRDAYIYARSATQASCYGDSGGPLLRNGPGGWVLVGVISSGSDSTCSPTVPYSNIDMRVSAYNDWIDSVIGAAPPVTAPGYWMVGADGGVFTFGSAGYFGNPMAWIQPALDRYLVSAVDIEPTPSGRGYWILDSAGRVFAFGDALYQDDAGLHGGERATSISATPNGTGYWIFTDRGRVMAFGDAPHHGDMSGQALNGPVLGSIATPSGGGYYMVASDGGIFAFGDAPFYGSTGALTLNRPVVGLAPTPTGAGYWLVASDGGIFTFGDATFWGSTGGLALNKPVIGAVTYGGGYLLVASDGGIFTFTDAPFLGSLGGATLARPITAVAGLG